MTRIQIAIHCVFGWSFESFMRKRKSHAELNGGTALGRAISVGVVLY